MEHIAAIDIVELIIFETFENELHSDFFLRREEQKAQTQSITENRR